MTMKKVHGDKILDTETGEIREAGRDPDYLIDTHFGVRWKTPWNHDTDAESLATAIVFKDESKTQQQFAADADINVILAKFMRTGELMTTGPAKYMDVEEEFDLQDKMVTGYQVQEAWNALPAAVRNILKDPKTFADYVTHCLETGDLDPLRELGLAKAEASEPPPPPGGTPDPDGGNAPPGA